MPQGTPEEQTGAAFTDDVLDEKYYGRPAPGVLGRTGLLLGVLIGGCLAVFGAWILLFDPLPEPAADQPVRITADAQPYKVRPEDPGGAEIPNQDRLVYDRLDRRPNNENEVETLISRPDSPPAPDAAPDAEQPEDSVPVLAQIPEPPAEVGGAGVESVLDAETPSVPETPVDVVAAAPQALSQVPSEPSPPPAAVPSVVSEVAPLGWSVQLVAMRSEQAALDAWQQFSRAQPDLLGPLAPRVVEADLGERGVFYRLKAGDWADRAPADALCAALQERRVECRVAAP